MNQNPEQLARDTIDRLFSAAGWVVQPSSNLLMKILCSIYNLWKQVLDYFDVFQVGLTATPDNRTFGNLDQNLVSNYGYEKAVIDSVLIPDKCLPLKPKLPKMAASYPWAKK